MSTVTLYGASDDLIEVEGDVPGCDEYGSDDQHFVLVGGDGRQARVRVWYTRRGVWAIAAARVDEDIAMLPVLIEEHDSDYSVKATVSKVQSVIAEATS